jgi:hypothetical protein
MTTHTPDPHAWLSQLDETPRSIDSLVDDGFEGFSLQDLTPWLGDASAMRSSAASTVRPRPIRCGS